MNRCKEIQLLLYIIVFGLGMTVSTYAETLSPQDITTMIQAFKKDERGPFQAVKWFCPDGEVLPAQSRCPKPGGIQHALHKENVQKLARDQGIYLGQILAGTSYEEFLDARSHYSRMKQYQLEKYLQAADNGWIFKRAVYYRGAVQAEDEEMWGEGFLKWILSDNDLLESRFYMVRQIAGNIPHTCEADQLAAIRAGAKVISDMFPGFSDLRVKLHGKPDAGDVRRVAEFYEKHREALTEEVDALFLTLIRDLETYYHPPDIRMFRRYQELLPGNSDIRAHLKRFIGAYGNSAPSRSENTGTLKMQSADIADLLLLIRLRLGDLKAPSARLAMMDLSLELEHLLFRNMAEFQADTAGDLLDKAYILAKAATGCGFLEIREWLEIVPHLPSYPAGKDMMLADFQQAVEHYQRMVSWGSGMVRSVYTPQVDLFAVFEPLASGFIDDRVRSSLLLPFGDATAALSDILSRKAGMTGDVMGGSHSGGIRGLNPGYAMGELVVIREVTKQTTFSDKKIYAILKAPPDLKPVAGILSVSEGNPVSHVQLLARNLGIPNAVISDQTFAALASYSGRQVFYAVSPGGAVVLKPASEMTSGEKKLAAVTDRSDEKVFVPMKRIDLKNTGMVSLGSVRAVDSGRICGPKAANLGQLKSIFPEMVGEGIVIPFGVFRRHMDLEMKGAGMTYWAYLQETFVQLRNPSEVGGQTAALESTVLERLGRLQDAIRQIELLPDFQEELKNRFVSVLGRPMGRIPVFIRSDTNMEDLKDFTGAGLNLTVFNVAEMDKIWQGIRDVWASPYAERSYRWRQRYMRNPENVFPSILILPTVNVDTSGVMITSGVLSGNPADTTVAFCRGPGGAVEGQAAESWLLRADGSDILLSPAREEAYNILPETGGIIKGYSDFHQPVLSSEDLQMLRRQAMEIRRLLPGAAGIDSQGPFDVELGFKNSKLMLFQARPYVENKQAGKSAYLLSLDTKPEKDVRIRMGEKKP